MENTPNPVPTPSSDISELESLRHLVLSTLVLVIILSGTFNIYLWRQLKYARADLTTMRPQANQIVGDYNKSFPGMQEFMHRLTEFGRTNPDFVPILAKYGQQPTNAPVSAPVTKGPPAKK